MHRFYADERGVQNGAAFLCEEDARHALRVLRMKVGEGCELFAQGQRFSGEIASIGDDGVRVAITGEMPSTEASLRITLYQGLPKADKMELIVQKSVELGASAVVPVAMSRCVVQLDQKDGRKKQERWQKIAREACKQSGRCQMLQVSEPITFKQLLSMLPSHAAAIVPWEDARGYSLARFHQEHPDITDLAIVIGPEGGMSEGEIAQMKDASCRSVTLGPRILRTETAGLCAISALLCLYGDME
ncbi:MAG: 16S rRNA (uracil(1498)-N(3))-methyltransferase [Clostridia bacterium]|nr:16S rRNA (uracil(1498)-N(3))-methyltransferase [Clostridia bacterium]